MAIKKKKIQLKKLVFFKPVEMSCIEKELHELNVGGRVAGEEQKHLLASHELSGGLSCLV